MNDNILLGYPEAASQRPGRLRRAEHPEVKHLLLGGGGAEQDPILPGRTSVKVLADYPPDLFWKGQPPKEDIFPQSPSLTLQDTPSGQV